MLELFHNALAAPNICYTVLLTLVILYWLFVIIGAMDMGSIDVDFDLDADLDADFDLDGDLDHHVELEGTSGLSITGFLHFFNFGKMPFMIIMSFLVLFAWMGSVLGNYYLGNGSFLVPLALIFPNLFLSLCLTKMITTPLVPVFEKLDHEEKPIDYIGMDCEIILPATETKLGQAKVIVDNSPLLIQIKQTTSQNKILKKGQNCLIIKKETNCYVVHAFDTACP